MAIQLFTFSKTTPIPDAPQKLNENFSALSAYIEDIIKVVNTSSNTIALTKTTTLTDGGAEVKYLVISGASGIVTSIVPAGSSVPTFTLSSNGDVKANAITSESVSTKNITITEKITTKDIELTGKITRGNGSILVNTYKKIDVLNANTGSSGTKIDISVADEIFLNYNNSNTALSNSGVCNIDFSNMVVGQKVTIHRTGNNPNGNSLFNGANLENFAKFSKTTGNIEAITSAAIEFSSTTDESSITLQCILFSPGINKLLVLEKNNVTI